MFLSFPSIKSNDLEIAICIFLFKFYTFNLFHILIVFSTPILYNNDNDTAFCYSQ